jgi:hypothetical protein
MQPLFVVALELKGNRWLYYDLLSIRIQSISVIALDFIPFLESSSLFFILCEVYQWLQRVVLEEEQDCWDRLWVVWLVKQDIIVDTGKDFGGFDGESLVELLTLEI